MYVTMQSSQVHMYDKYKKVIYHHFHLTFCIIIT